MTIRFWLNKVGEQAMMQEEVVRGNGPREILRLEGFEVRGEGDGVRYIDVYVDPLDPAAAVPSINRRYFSRVSYVERYWEGFRWDGLYKIRGATARVATKEKVHNGHGVGSEPMKEISQEISISAMSVTRLRMIYSLVRTGELYPRENWGVHFFDIDKASQVPSEA